MAIGLGCGVAHVQRDRRRRRLRGLGPGIIGKRDDGRLGIIRTNRPAALHRTQLVRGHSWRQLQPVAVLPGDRRRAVIGRRPFVLVGMRCRPRRPRGRYDRRVLSRQRRARRSHLPACRRSTPTRRREPRAPRRSLESRRNPAGVRPLCPGLRAVRRCWWRRCWCARDGGDDSEAVAGAEGRCGPG